MTIITDETGRHEIGFPYRAWPRRDVLLEEAAKAGISFDNAAFEKLVSEVNIRFATSEDTERVVQFMDGLAPVYRSVYRFTQFSLDERKPVRESAIVDKLFWEFEHQDCGKLCEHTRADVCRFINWLRLNKMEPWIIYSGGKSLHVYILLEPVPLRKPHEVVKKALKTIEHRSRIQYADPNAMLGTAQLARVMNAKNVKTGLYAIPLRPDEVLSNPVGWVTRVAQKPRQPSWTPQRTKRLADLMKDLDEQFVLAELNDILFPPPSVQTGSKELCQGIKKVHEAAPDSPIRGHKALFALLNFCKNAGMTKREAEDYCMEWNRRSVAPMTRSYVRVQANSVFGDKKTYNPCLVAVPLVGRCPICYRNTFESDTRDNL